MSNGGSDGRSIGPVGWFPDQQNPKLERYFDGERWTSWRQAGGGPEVPIVALPPEIPPKKKMPKSGVVAIAALLAVPVLVLGFAAWGGVSRNFGGADDCQAFFAHHDAVSQQLKRVESIANDGTMSTVADALEKEADAIEGVGAGFALAGKRDAYIGALRTVANSARGGVVGSSADLAGAQELGEAGLVVAEHCTVQRDDLVALAQGQALSPDKTTAAPAPAPAPPREPVKTEAQRNDEHFQARGFEVAESGSLYIRALDTSEFTCGYWDCLYYEVYTIRGCPSVLYVEASVMLGGAVVGMANDMVGGLRANESAFVKLEDIQGVGDSFRVNKVNCY